MPYDDQFWQSMNQPPAPPPEAPPAIAAPPVAAAPAEVAPYAVGVAPLGEPAEFPLAPSYRSRGSGLGGLSTGLRLFGLIGIVAIGLVFATMAKGFGTNLSSSRNKALDAYTKLQLESLASAQEGYRSQYGRYGSYQEVTSYIRFEQLPPSITLSVVYADKERFCLSGKYKRTTLTYYFDNDRGLLPDGQTCT